MGIAFIFVVSCAFFLLFFTILKQWIVLICALLSNEYAFGVVLVISCISALVWFW